MTFEPLALARAHLSAMDRSPRGPFGIGGCVGDALFACALRSVAPDVDPTPWLARAVARWTASPAGPSLQRGLAGLGLVLATYGEGAEILASIDRLLARGVELDLPPASLQGGVAGIALYACARGNHALQRAVLERLASAAEPWDDGVVWRTPRAYARARGIPAPDAPVTELGMAHGGSGALLALAALSRAGHDDAGRLARAGLAAAWRLERPSPNRFGRVLFGARGELGAREYDDRRFCVADPGVLRALWLTATAIGDADSAARAQRLLREEAARDAAGAIPGERGRLDLCCGVAPVAQVYGRMHRETGDAVFGVAAARLLRLCAERIHGVDEPSFAYGRAGVLLALAAPDGLWDAILGVSLPS